MNAQTIKDRLDYIKLLESLSCRVVANTNIDTHELESFRIYADVNSTKVPKDICDCNLRREISGELHNKILKINEFIKQEFKPLIDRQKELIKKEMES